MAGLVAPLNIRQLPQAANSDGGEPLDVVIDVDEGGDKPVLDERGNTIQIKHDDGSITISTDGQPISRAKRKDGGEWFANLAEDLDQQERTRVCEDLLIGINDDLTSRKDWVGDRALGLKMLGLRVELPGVAGASEGAPTEGMSRVRHSLMLEACLRFQANARSELLPTDGPVKVRNDDNGATTAEDNLADDLERDMNHYLTVTATEYYPDTDRMLLTLGFGGTEFKKGYFCPLRNRPAIEWVNANDLIVNNSATDLANAKRITHRLDMAPNVVKRLQILGVYRQIPLSDPLMPKDDAVKREEMEQQGIQRDALRVEDRDREIYECYCELDLKGYEHKLDGEPTGLPVPYRATIDVSSRELLSLVRDYNEDTKDMPVRRRTFVQYLYVPGFGFYGIGLLHILGNTTAALTAALREMIDNGMFANFPGALIAKGASRQNTTINRIPPGGLAQIDTQGMSIHDAIMALPYQTQHMAPLMALMQDVAQNGQRLGGISEVQVGEGRADAPVGTTLAMLEQATKVENSVHKRLCVAQAEEFEMLKEMFLEHPESFWQQKRKMARQWDEDTFRHALENCNLVPQADPNTASHTQRIIKYMGLRQMAAAQPTMYDPFAIDEAGLKLLGFGNPSEFFSKTPAPPSPEAQAKMAQLQIEQTKAQAQAGLAAAKVDEIKTDIAKGPDQPTSVDMMDAKSRLEDSQTKAKLADLKGTELQVEDHNRDLDRASHEKIALLDLARDVMNHPSTAEQSAGEVPGIEKDAGVNGLGEGAG